MVIVFYRAKEMLPEADNLMTIFYAIMLAEIYSTYRHTTKVL